MFGHQDLMLYTSTGKPFMRSGWLFELKYDGFRVLIVKQEKRVGAATWRMVFPNSLRVCTS